MLDIRTYRSDRNGIRIDILRKYRHLDDAGKVKFNFKQLGSFHLGNTPAPDLLALLDNEEVLQLENWLAEVQIGQAWKTEVEEMTRVSLLMPPSLLTVMNKIYLEAKRVGIRFVPHEVMLDCLTQKMGLVEGKIDKVNGFSCRLMENAGFKKPDKNGDEKEQQRLADGRALFKTLLELAQPIGRTCSELEEAALRYGKAKKIPPPQLREWAGDMPGRNQEKPIKHWCYAVAIDVLAKHLDSLHAVLPENRLLSYWGAQQTERLTVNEAREEAIKLFKSLSSQDIEAALLNEYTK